MNAKPVGFDQKLLLHQLDFTANEARKSEKNEMYEKLDDFLFTDIKGHKSRKNTITMLMKIWYLVNGEQCHLQKKAFDILINCSQEERVLLHYGMTVLAYPFFKELVQEMGKLFKLQDEITTQQIGRVMKSLYGDRRRVEVAISAVLVSLKSWGVLSPGGTRQTYVIGEKIKVTSDPMKQWLAETIVRSSERTSLAIEMLNSQPAFFSFEYHITHSNLRKDTFEINRQGLDMIMVEIK